MSIAILKMSWKPTTLTSFVNGLSSEVLHFVIGTLAFRSGPSPPISLLSLSEASLKGGMVAVAAVCFLVQGGTQGGCAGDAQNPRIWLNHVRSGAHERRGEPQRGAVLAR